MIVNRYPKSPLRYVGGKSRGLEILEYMPSNTQAICAPFIGGGALELVCANNGITVYGYDNFKPLVGFWQCLLNNPKKLTDIVRTYYPLSKSNFYKLQKTYNDYRSKYERAAIYFVLNRASFSGTTLSGGMSPNHPRFTESSIERLSNFHMDNFHVDYADFKKSIPKYKKLMLYLDPPYMVKHGLYGTKGNMHNGFDHAGLAKLLHRRDKWILSYNDSDKIRELYKGYQYRYPKWKYGMSNDKNSREILILSHDLVNEDT